jgi:hypothetical protein
MRSDSWLQGTNDDDDVSEELKLLKALSAKLLQAVQSFNAAEGKSTSFTWWLYDSH